MKKMIYLLLLSALLCACLPAAGSAEGETADYRCADWRFTVRVPDGMNVYPWTCEDPDTDEVFCGGVILSAGGEEDVPRIGILRRSRFFNAYQYLSEGFPGWLDGQELSETDFCKIYDAGGMALYGNMGIVYGPDGDELYREYRLIPAGDNHGTEFAVCCTAENEAETLSLLDTVIRGYRADEEPEAAEARFLPIGYTDETDLRNGEYLFRVKDADRIETDGYFTAVLYRKDYYAAEDVRAMKPGDTILAMDKVLTIDDFEPEWEEDPDWYETWLGTKDAFLGGKYFGFTMTKTENGDDYWLYFGDDCHTASKAGEIRIRVPQEEPAVYCANEESGVYVISEDLPGSLGSDPDMFGIAGWNEYTHLCCLTDGRLTRVETWPYPVNPEDVFAEW